MKVPKCPICSWTTSQYTLRKEAETRHHITTKAKQELWAKEFEGKIKTPHLDLFRKSIKEKKVEIKYIVNYDL